ncbi:MAG: hypothetical protein AAF701_06610, partial [Pseudomonadota bacterium]
TEISRILNGLPDDTGAEVKHLRGLILDLQKTRKELLSLEERIAHETTTDPTHSFDFAALRADIGGRLDKLRTAAGAKGFSEQPK